MADAQSQQSWIADVCNEINAVAQPEVRAQLLRAFRASLRFPERAEDCPSVTTIAHSSGVPEATLASRRIVLGKKEARVFLNGAGLDAGTESSFKRKYGENQYRRLFGRSPGKSGRKLLFTYAEWCWLVGLTTELQIPESCADAASTP
jgi:hypothetical protein